jgi:hypothetical protein
MNTAAQAIADQIKPGTVLAMIGRDDIPNGTVEQIKGKSVYFTDGTHMALRSLHRMVIVSL